MPVVPVSRAHSLRAENGKDATVWEQKNDALRHLGLRTIPNPKEAE